jgi:hypothetical protein
MRRNLFSYIHYSHRHIFPMDRAMFEDNKDLENACHERPAGIGRREKSGDLEGVLVAEAKLGLQFLYYLFGYAFVIAGGLLLIDAHLNSPNLTW